MVQEWIGQTARHLGRIRRGLGPELGHVSRVSESAML